MKKTLSEFITEINQSRKSGLLSVTVKGANTLLKLFFREGEIYHLTCGNAKGAGCLAQVAGNEFADYFFMGNVSLNVNDGDVPPLTDIIQLFGNHSAAGEVLSDPALGRGQQSIKKGDLSMAQEQLKLALIRQIGPAGAKVVKKIVDEIWKPSSPPGKQDFLRLADLLKDEIESDEDRTQFLKETREILS